MKKNLFLLAALLAVSVASASLAQHGPNCGPPATGGKGGQPAGGGKNHSPEVGGIVSALAADGSTFTLTETKGVTVTVTVSATTTIKHETDGSVATLANGLEVDVIGTPDATGKTIAATAILVDKVKPVPPTPKQFFGAVSALAAGGSSFTLTGDHNGTLTVTVSATTTITNYSDGSVATLANGQKVIVTGTLDSTDKTLAATSIVVDDHKPQPAKFFGAVSALAASGSSFTLTGQNGAAVTVNVGVTTKITNLSDGSPATLANGQNVLVVGTLDSTGKIVTATTIVVDDHKPQPVKFFGAVSALATDGSFTLTGDHNGTLAVTVSATTTITNYSDGSVATLANGQKVIVTGTLDSTGKTLAATSIVVDDRKPPVVLQAAIGIIASVDAIANTFVLTVAKANFTPTGKTVTVATTAKTAYYGHKGKLTFADLKVGATVLVVGTFDATTQTLTATNIEVGK